MDIELKVIESELVPVYMTDKGEKVVNGRELHKVLQSKQDFSTWVKARLKECDSVENGDYELLHNPVEQASGAKHRIDYIIKLATAKEIAMLERNEKGKQVRRYFISIEERYKENQFPMTTSGQIRLIAQGYMELEQKIDEHKTRIENLENNMTIDYGQQRVLEDTVNKTVIDVLGGKGSYAYEEIGRKVFAECNRDLKHYFNVNARNNIPKKRFDEAVEYAKNWKPCTNTMMLICNYNAQKRLAV